MTVPTWKIVKLKSKELKPHPKNPRRITTDEAAHLKNSLSKFGLIDKPIVNTDNVIIGGHQRFRLLKKSGYKEIECWVPDRLLEEKEVEELMIRLNKNSGKFDFDMLANQFEGLDLLDWGFSGEELFGMGGEDSDKKTKTKKEKEVSEEEPEAKKKECPSCGFKF